MKQLLFILAITILFTSCKKDEEKLASALNGDYYTACTGGGGSQPVYNGSMLLTGNGNTAVMTFTSGCLTGIVNATVAGSSTITVPSQVVQTYPFPSAIYYVISGSGTYGNDHIRLTIHSVKHYSAGQGTNSYNLTIDCNKVN